MTASRHSRCPTPPVDPDALDRGGLTAWNAHLAACDRCRCASLGDDPSRLFAVLADDPMPVGVLDAVSTGVAEAIDGERRGARWRPAVALAAAVLLAGAMLAALVPRAPRPSAPVAAELAEDRVPGLHRADVQLTGADGDVRVVDLTVGDRQVVMIFDGSLQL